MSRYHKENLAVSLTSFYNKINATEQQTSEAIVAHVAKRACELQDQLGFVPYEALKGYNVYALDGNHLQESEKRLKPGYATEKPRLRLLSSTG